MRTTITASHYQPLTLPITHGLLLEHQCTAQMSSAICVPLAAIPNPPPPLHQHQQSNSQLPALATVPVGSTDITQLHAPAAALRLQPQPPPWQPPIQPPPSLPILPPSPLPQHPMHPPLQIPQPLMHPHPVRANVPPGILWLRQMSHVIPRA